ncbi:hypothetical protein MYIN104542_30125 [Mycobacterium intermedium]
MTYLSTLNGRPLFCSTYYSQEAFLQCKEED